MNAKKIQKDMERWAKAKNKQQAKANPPKAEPEESSVPEELSSVVSIFLVFVVRTQNLENNLS